VSCSLFSLYCPLFVLFLLCHFLCLSPLSISILFLSLSLCVGHIHWCKFYNRTKEGSRQGSNGTKDATSQSNFGGSKSQQIPKVQELQLKGNLSTTHRMLLS
jgi:hypothetical protein